MDFKEKAGFWKLSIMVESIWTENFSQFLFKIEWNILKDN